ncbi:hypothetical protein N1030_11955 [Desulfovibrio mangrovi]|uniref:hypothetical protein n=1 Tax=Desulfovibrio mangrovi TaxID=2976983 RepID=UPI002245828C|nr:hypothetical protein [Desulfovibrio mangrovi]UZP66327.1 hypothetical protein N1030_11955 [Desulfovibrio mangrovi]
MQIATMAKSPLRQMQYPTDLDAFRESRGGHLGGTMHCARYLGPRVLWDSSTGEFISEEGVAMTGLEHLEPEFRLVLQHAGEALGTPVHIDGVLIPVQQGNPHFRIYDIFTPEGSAPVTLWQEINLLADMFARIDSSTIYTRPVQYFHTASMNSDTRITRWLKTWTTRPGCGGVFFKDMEFVYTPNAMANGACVALSKRK